MITSANCFAIAAAVAPSSARLKARMPPKAEVGSVLNAFSYAAPRLPASAAPQGLACLTMTHAGSPKCFTHSHAASASAILLYESALPCSWRNVARLPGTGFSSR